MTERLKALAGLRFERFEHDYDNKLNNAGDFTKAENGVTPRFGLIYDLTDTLAVYANTARSFKPNSGTPAAGGGFEPEKGKSYELGLKWEALERQLSVDAAIYHIVKENRSTPTLTWPPARSAAVAWTSTSPATSPPSGE